MPARRIPKSVLRKLRFYRREIRGLFSQFRNIDTRGIHEENPHEHFPRGQRVREIDLSKTSIVPVALKWVHDATARQTLRVIFAKVKMHNRRFGRKEYHLVMPKAYVLDKEIVAMSKEDYPTLEEVVHRTSPRGKRVYEHIQKKSPKTIEKLPEIARLLESRTGIRDDNVLFIRVRRGKPVLVPLIDLF